MSTGQERNIEPTARRKREARRQGDIPVSRDLAGSAALLAVLAAAGPFGEWWARRMAEAAQRVWSSIGDAAGPDARAAETCLAAYRDCLLGLIGVVGVIGLLGGLATLVQVRPLWTWHPLMPQLARMNPAAGLRRMFLDMQTWVDLLKNVVKLTLAAWIAWCGGRALVPVVLTASHAAPLEIGRMAFCALRGLLMPIGAAWLVIGAGDYLFQRWHWRRRNCLTRDEFRKEHEENEGKPEHRRARRARHCDIAEMRMMSDAPTATVMLANPTHLLVALRFDPRRDHAPRVVAKGAGPLAEALRRIARAHQIPIAHNVMLARALYRLPVDAMIPETLYESVRCVLVWVEEIARARGVGVPWAAQTPGTPDAEPPGERSGAEGPGGPA